MLKEARELKIEYRGVTMCCTEQGQLSEEALITADRKYTTRVDATAVICENEYWISF